MKSHFLILYYSEPHVANKTGLSLLSLLVSFSFHPCPLTPFWFQNWPTEDAHLNCIFGFLFLEDSACLARYDFPLCFDLRWRSTSHSWAPLPHCFKWGPPVSLDFFGLFVSFQSNSFVICFLLPYVFFFPETLEAPGGRGQACLFTTIRLAPGTMVGPWWVFYRCLSNHWTNWTLFVFCFG